MILLFICQCLCSRPDQFQFNITTEATNAFLHQANDNIFFQIPLPRLAFLVHSTDNVIISVNVNVPPDNKHPNRQDFSNVKHMGFVGPYSRSFGVFFGDNTGSISVHCNNDTLFSFSTIFIPPECDVVHISSSPIEFLDIYSKTLIEKKMGRDTLDPNKTICIWHSTLHTVNTTIEANGVNESNGLVLDYVTPTSNYQYNINTDICNDLPSALNTYNSDIKLNRPSNNFLKNNVSTPSDELISGKRINNWRNSSSLLFHNQKIMENNLRKDKYHNYKNFEDDNNNDIYNSHKDENNYNKGDKDENNENKGDKDENNFNKGDKDQNNENKGDKDENNFNKGDKDENNFNKGDKDENNFNKGDKDENNFNKGDKDENDEDKKEDGDKKGENEDNKGGYNGEGKEKVSSYVDAEDRTSEVSNDNDESEETFASESSSLNYENKEESTKTNEDEDEEKKPPAYFPDVSNPYRFPIECGAYFHYGWFNNTQETPPPTFNDPQASPTKPQPTKSQQPPTHPHSQPTQTQTPVPKPTEMPIHTEHSQPHSKPPHPPTQPQTNSPKPPVHPPSHSPSHQLPTKSRHPTKSPSPHPTPDQPPFFPKPPKPDFFIEDRSVKRIKIEEMPPADEKGASTLFSDNNHQGNTFIFMRISQDIKFDASVLVKVQTNLLNNETIPNFKEFQFHSKIIPSNHPQFLIDEQNFPMFPGNNDFMPPRPDFDPDDEEGCGMPNKNRPNGGKFLVFGDETLYKKFHTIVVSQIIACFICMFIIIACVVYVLSRKNKNEINKMKAQLIMKEQREIELGMKTRPHIPQANNPLPQILVERITIGNNNNSNNSNNNDTGNDDERNISSKNEWESIDEISDTSSG